MRRKPVKTGSKLFQDVEKMILGNKCDMEEKRVIRCQSCEAFFFVIEGPESVS
jgi:hypothetical protein